MCSRAATQRVHDVEEDDTPGGKDVKVASRESDAVLAAMIRAGGHRVKYGKTRQDAWAKRMTVTGKRWSRRAGEQCAAGSSGDVQ